MWVPDREEVWCQAVVNRWEDSDDIPKLFLTLLDGTVSLSRVTAVHVHVCVCCWRLLN